MSAPEILYVSDGGTLGHVAQDFAIATALRKLVPEARISWLAGSPATEILETEGQELLPECADWPNTTEVIERVHGKGSGVLARWTFENQENWARSLDIFLDVTSRRKFDLAIGGAAYGVAIAFKHKPHLKKIPFVYIHVCVGVSVTSWWPTERRLTRRINKIWAMDMGQPTPHFDLGLVLHDFEDIPDKRFGWGLPRRRDYAAEKYKCVGNVVRFDPRDYQDRAAVRRRLGHGSEPLIVCAVGGSAIGKGLLELCARAFPIARNRVPGLKMVLVGGPRIDPTSIKVPEGVEVRGYVPRLYEHFAACDLAIIQGGGATSIELTALRRPFLFFPIEGHGEQCVDVAGRLKRLGAGTKMWLSKTTPTALADAIVKTIGTTPTYPAIATDGAGRSASLIAELLERSRRAEPVASTLA